SIGAARQDENLRSRAVVRRGTSEHPVYEADRRLETVVKVVSEERHAAYLRGFLEELGKDADLILQAQPGIRDAHLRYVSPPQPLRKVLDQLAALYDARWYAVGDRYVL